MANIEIPQRNRDHVAEFDDEEIDDFFDDIPLLLNELQQRDLPLDVQSVSEEITTERDAYIAFENAIHNLREANVDSEKSCASCSKKVRVENVLSFRKGQQIALPGQNATKFVKYWHKLEHMYKHHAIIKEIIHTSGTRIEMKVIHFSKENKKIRIYESVNTYDLVLDELYIVEYIHPRYSAEEIVDRAEKMLPSNNNGRHKFGPYNPLTNNCEHFATFCVVGEGESFQCQKWRKRLVNFFRQSFGVGTKVAKITKIIIRILMTSSDEIAAGFAMYPECVLGGVSVVYLIYCIVMTAIHKKEFQNGSLCKTCFKGKLQDLWITFAVFCTTSVFTYVMIIFALPLLGNPLGIPLIIISVLLSVVLQWCVPRIRKALKSPFGVSGKRIKTLSEIEIGDVVVLKYYKFEHEVIVTEVHEHEESSLKGAIRFVHYGLQNLFGTREITEEYLTINLEKTSVKRIDCSHLLTNAPEKTVMLARKRVGEKKWALTSNRSDNLCYWAKVQQRPRSICINRDNGDLGTSSTKDLSSLYTRSTEVHLENDLHLGDVIKYEKTGILVGKEVVDIGKGRRLKIEMIVYDWEWYFSKKTYTVDLNKDRIIIKHYHPAHCIPMAERKDRANRLEGTKGTWWTNKGFIKHCIMLNL